MHENRGHVLQLASLVAVLTFAAPGAGFAQVPTLPTDTVIIDLPEAGGHVRGFELLWVHGLGEAVGGLATDKQGNVYFTSDGVLHSVRGDTGALNWTQTCPSGPCRGVAVDKSSVYTTWGDSVSLARFKLNGTPVCDVDAGFVIPDPFDVELVPADGLVVVQTSGNSNTGEMGRLLTYDEDCQLQYDIPSPLRRRGNGNPVIDRDRGLLVSYWGDPDFPGSLSTVFTQVYDLYDGTPLCHTMHGAFRQMLERHLLWHGVGVVAIHGTHPNPPALACDPSDDDTIGTVFGVGTGDVRDLAHDSSSVYVLSNPYDSTPGPGGGHPGRLIKVKRGTHAIQWMSTDFGTMATPITNVNKMGIANRWAIVTHGMNGTGFANTRMATIVDLTSGGTVGRFGRTRIHRLPHERLIDGGIFFHAAQYGIASNPNTPLLAWSLGRGEYQGHSNRYGDERGNKYCGQACLPELQGVAGVCSPVVPGNVIECKIQNLYDHAQGSFLFNGLPPGMTYEARDRFGNPLGSGVGEVPVQLNLASRQADLVFFHPDFGDWLVGQRDEASEHVISQ